VRRFRDRFSVAGLAAGNNVDLLIEQIKEFSPKSVYITSRDNANAVKERFRGMAVYNSDDGIEKIVEEADYDILLNALVGAIGFRPTAAALQRGKRVALANKESLVIGGDYIRGIIGRSVIGDDGSVIMDNHTGGILPPVMDIPIINNNNSPTRPLLLPIDSEHSAILQCLQNAHACNAVESIILTASGGPFRDMPEASFASITPEQALNHPTWAMGKKISIDSSTLMNKGFEAIEAHHLFGLPYPKLKICVHPQSIIHSLVEFHDGAVLAQLGLPDMELPIQYALSWPERLPIQGNRLNLSDIGTLDFYEPDMDKFPCLRLCIEAGQTGGTAPAAINAANEVAVELFLTKKIGYTDIARIVEIVLKEHIPQKADSIDVIEGVDKEIRCKIMGRFGR
jgi:1-deoxy-D-xylulose-5-phosphate reductoisomerase